MEIGFYRLLSISVNISGEKVTHLSKEGIEKAKHLHHYIRKKHPGYVNGKKKEERIYSFAKAFILYG